MPQERLFLPSYLDEGFTIVELVVTLVVVGILAVTVIPRFANRADFDARGYFDATASILRYAQKSAVAQRRTVCVNFGANSSVTLTLNANFGAACNTALAGPDGTAPYALNAPPGVSFDAQPANFTFLATGAASQGQAITVKGLPGRILTVWAATGYVQEN